MQLILTDLYCLYRLLSFENITEKKEINVRPRWKCQSVCGLSALFVCVNSLRLLRECTLCVCDTEKESHREPENLRNSETVSGGGRPICS